MLDVPADFTDVEGRRILRMHLSRERSAKLVAAKKASTSHVCEICGFDSMSLYGVDYCEAHHRTPVSDLEENEVVTLKDLMIVCANCHRVIHSVYPPITPERLIEMIAGAN